MNPAEVPGAYLQHSDGSWSVVGPDGWPVTLDEYCAELTGGAAIGIAPASGSMIEVEPLSVRDVELGKELDR